MSSVPVFLDTAFVQALFNSHDQYHILAKKLYPPMQSASQIWTSEAVLTEIGNAFSVAGRDIAVRFIDLCYSTTNITVVSVDASLFQRALSLYRNRSDKDWGLTDCISFVIMQDQHLVKALTTDRHFVQAGFRA